MTMLSLSINDDEPLDEQLRGPGGASRLCFGERGTRSSIWRVWANKSTSDVYAGVRNLTGVQKYSFHESGDWRFQWTTTAVAQAFTEDDKRIIDQWDRPPEPEHGWTRCLNIVIPPGHLTPLENDPHDNQILFVPPPDDGELVMLTLMIATPNKGEVQLKGLFPVDGFTLKSGQSAVIMYGKRPMTADDETLLDNIAERVRSHMNRQADVAELVATAEGARVGFFKPADDGVRSVFDLSVSALLARPVPDQPPSPPSSGHAGSGLGGG